MADEHPPRQSRCVEAGLRLVAGCRSARWRRGTAPRILGHLLALSERDRYLRFGYPATDAQIGRYVDQLDFDHDEVFGIFNRRLELIAMAHLAYLQASDGAAGRWPSSACRCCQAARGRGYGGRLFDHAVLHARNRGIDSLFIHALSENTAMLRSAAMPARRIERDGAESQAWLKLPPDNLVSHVEAMVEDTRPPSSTTASSCMHDRGDALLSELGRRLIGSAPRLAGCGFHLPRAEAYSRDRGVPRRASTAVASLTIACIASAGSRSAPALASVMLNLSRGSLRLASLALLLGAGGMVVDAPRCRNRSRCRPSGR